MSDLLVKKLNGFHLIDASAGTGKTYTITALVVRLLLEKGYSLAEILIVTYTEAAAGDLRKRVRDVLIKMRRGYEEGEAGDQFIAAMLNRDDLDSALCLKRIQHALNEFDEAAIFTIHGFCQRSLKENGLESGMAVDVELEKDMSSFQYQVACDYWRQISVDLSARFLGFCGGKLYPENLMFYFRNLRPDLEIIPDAQPQAVLDDLADRYLEGVERLGRSWQGGREELFALLNDQNSLNRRTYKPENFPVWFTELDSFFAAPSLEPPSCLRNFTATVVAKALKKNSEPVDHSFFNQAQAVWDDFQAMEESFKQQLLYLRRQFYFFADVELQRLKEEEGILAFDDLLLCLQKGLVGSGGRLLAARLRQQYPAILIDEFQDTDPTQFKIFTAIHGADKAHLLYLIGDPKQAIYNFRGADIFAYLKAASTVENRQSLAHNYRSEEGLIAGVNHLFNGVNPFLIDGIDFQAALFPDVEHNTLCVEGDDPAHIHLLFGERDPAPEGKKQTKLNMDEARRRVATGCCAEIVRLLDLGQQGRATLGDTPVQPQDIAILVRSNKEAVDLQNLLLAHGVASVVKGSASVFASSQSLELLYILEAVAHCRDQGLLITALATDCLGYSALDLHGLQDGDYDEIMTRFQAYHDLWLARGFMAMFQSLLSGEGIRTRLLSQQGGERELTNLLHLGELLHKQAVKDPSISALIMFYKKHLTDDVKNDEFEQRLESDSKRLQILTIHKAKGLEFPIVFCPFLWQGLKGGKGDTLFHAGPEKQLTLDLGSADLKEHKGIAAFEENAENLRLAYVALTRATNRCVLNWGGYGSFATSPLGYLLHGKEGDFGDNQKTLAKLQDAELLAVAEDVAAASSGSITVRENQTTIPQFISVLDDVNGTLESAQFKAEIDLGFQVTSFSKLTSGHHHESLISDRDHVDGVDGFTVAPALNLFDFPRGANPGTFLHYLFEYLDFTDLDSDESRHCIREVLARFGYEEKWQQVMEKMMADVCQVTLPHQDFCLADIAPARRLNELEFHIPVTQVDSRACSHLFRSLQGVGGEAWYNMLESYDFKLIKGFIKGFVDLIFMHQDRYFIIDWKSNYLGDHHGAYGREAMMDSMVQSGYILQYHLYSLALHRYLGLRLDDYNYERHFGGVVYVYLRGVTCKNNETGLFWDRPSQELMTGLDELFRESEEETI